MTLRLRKELLTELGAGELRGLAAAAPVSAGTCPVNECVERLVSAAVQTCFTAGCTTNCLSGEPSCPC